MKTDTVKQTKNTTNYRKVVSMLYLLAIILMTFSVLANILLKSNAKADYGLGTFETINEQWLSEGGTEFEIAQIDKLKRDSTDTVSIYHTLPKEIDNQTSIVFRSKNCYVDVFVDNNSIYKTQVSSAPFYNHSPGTRWNVISVQREDGGKKIEIKITQAYNDGRAKVDNFYYGDRGAILLRIIQSKLSGYMVSLIILFVGVLFLAAWSVLNMRRTPKDNSLLWLAAFALIAGGWSLLETNLFQLFTEHLQLIQVMDNMMLVLGGIPLFLYMDSIYNIFRHGFLRVLCGLNIAYVLFAVFSQMSGGWDYHQTLNGTVSTYGVVVVILIICLIGRYRNLKRPSYHKSRFLDALQPFGIISLGAGLFVDLVRYLSSDVLDRAFGIRIGLLGFIICFGAGNIYQMITLVQKGREAAFISHLAYQDGLTRTGNRTAYMEKLQSLEKEASKNPFALAMFDINNLKWINDTFGHKTGDELILHCSDLIKKAFSTNWQVFRIGGDEFVALLQDVNAEEECERAEEQLRGFVEEFNKMKIFVSPIAIAYGSSLCNPITKANIEIAEKEADINMYKNKKESKREIL